MMKAVNAHTRVFVTLTQCLKLRKTAELEILLVYLDSNLPLLRKTAELEILLVCRECLKKANDSSANTA